MPKLDELLRHELREAAPRSEPPANLLERLHARRRRRRVIRRAMSAALAVAVLAASAGVFVALDRAFTGGEDRIANPPALPENGDLLVSQPRDGGTSIYVLPSAAIPAPGEPMSDRGDLVQLWPGSARTDQLGVSVSPDGLRLAFARPSVDGNALWVANIDGSELTQVTEPRRDAWQPSWSPDGRHIAFVGRDAARDEQIFVMEPDGSNIFPITEGQVAFPASPTWSPDGTRIAFTGTENLDLGIGPRSIYTIALDGSDFERIEGTADVGTQIAWSPDGTRIAFTHEGIKLFDLRTGEVTTLSDPVAEGLPSADTGDAYDTDPAWSPDGTLVVFSRFDRVDRSVVYAVRADGSGLPYPLVVGRDPAWQPLPSALPSPEPTSEPTSEAAGSDIGLDRNVCRVERLGGLELVPGAPADVAWTGYLVNAQGKCSRNTEAQDWVVAIDVTGDGLADASTALTDPNCPYVSCAPLGGTDLDADGDQELIVNTFFSIVDHTYYSITPTDARVSIQPILVAPPGNPAANIHPGEPLHTSAAGDEGFAGWIRCEGYPEAPVLVTTWTYWPIETDLPREWHETKLQLKADGMFHVISTNDFELPYRQDPGLVRSDGPACGISFNPWANPPK